jgi:hypothetical protein
LEYKNKPTTELIILNDNNSTELVKLNENNKILITDNNYIGSDFDTKYKFIQFNSRDNDYCLNNNFKCEFINISINDIIWIDPISLTKLYKILDENQKKKQ